MPVTASCGTEPAATGEALPWVIAAADVARPPEPEAPATAALEATAPEEPPAAPAAVDAETESPILPRPQKGEGL